MQQDFSIIFNELIKPIKDLSRRVAKFETWEPTLKIGNTSTENTANPPSDAELDTAFGTPAEVGNGFIGLLDDNDADANVYLCVSNGTSWWYVALTKAV